MKLVTIIAAAAAAALVPAGVHAPVAAETSVPLPQFRSIELRGGGKVTLRHGSEQRVTMLRGDPSVSRFRVDGDGRLRIDACRSSCSNYRLEVEIVTPRVEAVAIRGGGSIDAEQGFPAQRNLAAAITGGGNIDVRTIAARSVAAAITGGGAIRTDARDSLAATVTGGGAITYLADPRTTVAIRGGGSVHRAR